MNAPTVSVAHVVLYTDRMAEPEMTPMLGASHSGP